MKKGIIIAVLLVVVLAILSIPGWFIYTRFLLPQYHISGDSLTLDNSVYLRKAIFESSDAENVGSTIGIAVEGERTITDLIWPIWVMEYKNDQAHDHIFVQGLMDVGTAFYKKSLQ